MPSPRLTIIGSANTDLIMKVSRLPDRGETVNDGAFLQTYGGKGANQAVAAARAGAATNFVTCLGKDAFTPGMIENFRTDGIDLTDAVHVTDQPSGTALVMIDESGHNYLTVAPGSNFALKAEHVAGAWPGISRSTLIILQMEIPVETNREILQRAKKAGIPVILNYAPAHDVIPDLLPGLHTLIVNENEAARLAGITPTDRDAARRAVKAMTDMGPERVILTLGSDGSMVHDGNEVTHVPAFPVPVKDTTAAGDTFCGALGAALLESMPYLRAIRFATGAAALSVSRIGAQPSIPFRPEIDHLLTHHL